MKKSLILVWFYITKSGWLHNNKMLLLCLSDSLSVWVIIQARALSDTAGLLPLFLLVFVFYASISLFPFIWASLCLPFASFLVASSSLCHYHLVHLLYCDCIWQDLYNGFTALRGITGIPEYFPATITVCFLSVPCCCASTISWLPASPGSLKHCNVRNTFSSAALHFKQVVLMHSSQFHPQSFEI